MKREQLEVGDRAVLINAGEGFEHMRGQLVTIASPLREIATRYGRMVVHEVIPDSIPEGMDNDLFVVPPQLLMAIEDTTTNTPGSWDDVFSFCGWDPRDRV